MNPFGNRGKYIIDRYIKREILQEHIYKKTVIESSNLSLWGERQVGKTNLIQHIFNDHKEEELKPNNIFFIFLELNTISNRKEFWMTCLNKLKNKIGATDDKIDTLLMNMNSFEVDTYEFKASLKLIFQDFTNKGNSILLILDEFDSASKYLAGTDFSLLVDLSHSREYKISIVTITNKNLSNIKPIDGNSNFSQSFDKIRLNYYNETEFSEYYTYLKGTLIDLIPAIGKMEINHEELKKQIVSEIGLHPYTLDCFSYHLIEQGYKSCYESFQEIISAGIASFNEEVIKNEIQPNLTSNDILNSEIEDNIRSIITEHPSINIKELKDFSILLSAILQFQLFNLEHPKYKNKPDIDESTFRDDLIEFLYARNIGNEISKESNVAGGRIEISFRNIIAELKIEKKECERQTLLNRYLKQPASYVSGKSKQLGILCILDLVEKQLPPSPCMNNLFFIKPELHGFQNNTPKYKVIIATVFIDGNTKNPSDYS
jgi:hypothetical protein